MIDQSAYMECLRKTDDVVINLVGLRNDIELLPYPIVLSIYTRAIHELKSARSLYLRAHTETVLDGSNKIQSQEV